MLNNLRYWLIEKLAGHDCIVLNCMIKGRENWIKFPRGRGYAANNTFIYPDREGITADFNPTFRRK